MDIKKIFSRKNRTEGVAESSNAEPNIGSQSSSSSSSPGRAIPSGYSENTSKSNDDTRSFQYSYNSNTNSLFSSKRTVSTAQSSHPSSNVSYGKGNKVGHDQQQAKIISIGRPLRVLNEEDDEEDEEQAVEFEKDKESFSLFDISSASTSPKMNNKIQTFPRKYSLSDDVSVITEKSSNSANARPSVSTDAVNVNRSETEARAQLNEFIKSQLRSLSSTIAHIIMQISQSVYNLTKASIKITESIESTLITIKSHKYLPLILKDQFTTISSIGLRRLVKHTLNLFDNILIGSAYDKSKALIMKNMYELFTAIKALPDNQPELTNFITYMSPTTFPIDHDANKFQEIEKVDHIMNTLLMKDKDKNRLLSDQDGSFIAPVQRGFCIPSLSVITFIFGFPKLSKEHHDVIKYFASQLDSVHFVAQKNRIIYASTRTEKSNMVQHAHSKSTHQRNRSMKLKSPFRTIDENQEYIPISMSLSADNANIASGTLGGYLYPKVPNHCMNPKILKYRGNVFGLTCAHVVLGRENEQTEGKENAHPEISIPSSVLINLYKNALVHEMMNHSETSLEYGVYSDAVKMIDEEYPVQKVQVEGKRSVYKNLPKHKFGSIIWGERRINSNRLSDIAIIKINAEIQKKKYVNYLGEDLQLSQYDPSLILSNLNVKRIVSLQPRKNGILSTANLSVFKVGSTTGYTQGCINGMKMIYWADGNLRSSEFIIAGAKGKMEGFANGGDSGAWILSKISEVNKVKSNYDELSDTEENHEEGTFDNHTEDSEDDSEEDYTKNSLTSFIESFIPRSKLSKRNNKVGGSKRKTRERNGEDDSGLGVLGMLHSYDGEFKQFGLFTPMDDVLDRLEQVTGVEWGVVGCSEEDDPDYKSISSGQSSTASEISIDE
jgi:hypothetical protein